MDVDELARRLCAEAHFFLKTSPAGPCGMHRKQAETWAVLTTAAGLRPLNVLLEAASANGVRVGPRGVAHARG